MPFQQGRPKSGGRSKGVPNKATKLAREAIAEFVEGNAWRLQGWLDQIAEDNPKAAFDCFMSVVDFHVPRLARTEVTGRDGYGLLSDLSDGEMLARLRSLAGIPRGGLTGTIQIEAD